MTRLPILVVALSVLCAAPAGGCFDPPDPVPPTPPTGGAYSTGGVGTTGGQTHTGGSVVHTGGVQPVGECSDPVDDCKAAECRLEELACETDGGVPLWKTPAGTPFATVCRAREADRDSLCPACLARIATCEDRHACKATDTGVCP